MARRENGAGSLYQRKDGTWQGRITLSDGARRSLYAPTRRECLAKMRTERERDAAGLKRGNETVGEYLDRWFRDVVQPHREYRTAINYRNHVYNHFIPDLGTIPLIALSVADVRVWLNNYIGTYKPGTINAMRATLVAALNEAINEDLIAKNVAARVPKIKGVEPHRAPLSRVEAERFIAAVTGDRLEALYRVALVCGLRINEALGLTWDRVDLATGATIIDRQIQRQPGRWVLKALKNRASRRTITLPVYARDALRAHRLRQQVEQERVAPWANEWGLVFTGPRGQPLYDARVRELWARFCNDAGLPHGSPHDFRHTATSLLIAQGVSPVDVAKMLGHATPTTTLTVYAQAFGDSADHVAGVMDDLFLED